MADRSFSFLVDNEPMVFSGRVHLSGKDDLSLYPSLFIAEFWNLPEESFLWLSRAKTLNISHAGACLVSGAVSDAFRREVPNGTITTVSISSGLGLWETPVSLTVDAGKSVSETVRQILDAAGLGICLLNVPAPDPIQVRPGTFFGRAADCIASAASAACCRPVLTPSGVMLVPENGLPVSCRITEKDLQGKPSFVGGSAHGAPSRMILTAVLAGWRPGETVEVSCGDVHAAGVISERSIDADTSTGAWKSELLVNLIH